MTNASELYISGGPLTNVEIGARGLNEIIQNVRMILATRVGQCVLDRHFGLRQDMVDNPMPVAKAKLVGEVRQKVEYYEPRVKVVRTELVKNPDAVDGRLVPAVVIRIRDGVAL